MLRLTTVAALAAALLVPCAAYGAEPGESALTSPTAVSGAVKSITGWTDRLKQAWVNEPLNVARNWQCVTFARFLSGIQIFGDAWTWWSKAEGKYARGGTPEAGSVLVFKPQGKMSRGHVAVVSQVVTERVIQITHANWSPIDGRRGQVEEDVTVVDVSGDGDWSQVKVWYGPQRDLGRSVYPTYGFIYQPDTRPAVDLIASSGSISGS